MILSIIVAMAENRAIGKNGDLIWHNSRDLKLGDFVHTFGDVHIYNNHIEQVKLQLTRSPRPLPTMHLNPEIKDIFRFKYEDFTLENYDPWPAIKGEVSV